jgi:predicted transcriptional regulator
MSRQNVNFKTEGAKVKALDRLAASMRRDRTFLLNEAVDQYLSVQEYHLKEIEKGLAEVKAGKTDDYEAVKASWMRRLKR